MIIQVCGTGGSGKSTVVRQVMSTCDQTDVISSRGRKRPVGYVLRCSARPGAAPLFVPGHYETPCGGCDTLKTPDEVFTRIDNAVENQQNVLFEGIIVQDDTRRTLALHDRHLHLLVIGLTTSLEDCLAGIRKRREARGDTRELNPKNTTDRLKRVERRLQKLEQHGVRVLRLDRTQAWQTCLAELGLA